MVNKRPGDFSKVITLRPQVLCWPYLPILVILMIVWADYIFNLNLVSQIPSSPYQIFIYSIIFGNPHIIASSLILLDSEYLSFYSREILKRIIIAAAAITLIWYFLGMNGFFAFFYAWTIVHVSKQQLGIGKMLNRQRILLYDIWSWLYILVSICIAIAIGFFVADTYIPMRIVHDISLYGGAVVVILGLYIASVIKKRSGRYYMLANNILLFATILCYLRGFTLFTILIPRIVHDVTAYIFYISHDTNRNFGVPRQLIYKATKPFLPIWLVCLTLSISLAYLLSTSDSSIVFYAGLGIIMLHYVTEAITWKGTGLHRKHLYFKLD